MNEKKIVKVKNLPIGKWFLKSKKWYSLTYVGTKMLKAKQIGSTKEYTFDIDITAEPQV